MNGRSPQALVRAVLLCALLSGLLSALLTTVGVATSGPARAAGYTPPVGHHHEQPARHPRGAARHHRHDHPLDRQHAEGRAIRVASWNIRSDDVVAALISAHQRGVGVRVIVDIGNANAKNPNEGVDRLHPAAHTGGARSGVAALRRLVPRHRRAAAHQVLPVQPGRALRARRHQHQRQRHRPRREQPVERRLRDARQDPVYRAFRSVFEQMWLDTPVAQRYRRAKDGKMTAMFYPFTGRPHRQGPDRARARPRRLPQRQRQPHDQDPHRDDLLVRRPRHRHRERRARR